MTRKLESIYGSHLSDFLIFKRQLGYKFVSKSFTLLQIDKLAHERHEKGPGLTKEFSEAWAVRRPNESYITMYERAGILQQFSRYLLDLGIDTYIPKLPPYKRSNFIPYIYTEDELNKIFKACDNMRMNTPRFNSSMFSVPALLRVLYGTGLRVGEALALRVSDVDLNEKYLKVRDSKNGRERIIPISVSLADICQQFLYYRNLLPHLSNNSEHFFIKKDGKNLSYSSIADRFRQCIKIAGIPFTANAYMPRLHDLRHTFAVNSMVRMCNEGMDLYVALPILSNYLGHSSIDSTNHYVRLTSAMYPELTEKLDPIYIDAFPRFNSYETN